MVNNKINEDNIPEYVPIDVACGPNNIFIIGRLVEKANIICDNP